MEPTAQAAEMRLAGFWRRMAVIFIDGAIFSAVLGAVLVAWILIEVFAFASSLTIRSKGALRKPRLTVRPAGKRISKATSTDVPESQAGRWLL